MTNSLVFLVRTLFDLYLFVLLLRFLFQFFRVDFYNPFSQFVYKATAPVTMSVQKILRFLPIEMICLLVLVAFQMIYVTMMHYLVQSMGIGLQDLSLFETLRLSLTRIFSEVIWLYTLSIFIHALLSWFGAAYYSPIGRLLSDLNEPILKPIRKILPLSSGLDFSPLIALIILNAIRVGISLPSYLL